MNLFAEPDLKVDSKLRAHTLHHWALKIAANTLFDMDL